MFMYDDSSSIVMNCPWFGFYSKVKAAAGSINELGKLLDPTRVLGGVRAYKPDNAFSGSSRGYKDSLPVRRTVHSMPQKVLVPSSSSGTTGDIPAPLPIAVSKPKRSSRRPPTR